MSINRDEKGRFVKGHSTWNKGKTLSEEHRRNMSEAKKSQIPWNKGKKGLQVAWNKGKTDVYSEESLKLMSEAKKGIHPKTEFRKGNVPWLKGLTKDDDPRIKAIAQAKVGKPRFDVRAEKHPNWKGGYEPYYGPNWNEQRKLARQRDKGICWNCGSKEDAKKHDTHHITPFRVHGVERYEEANDLENLMTLCPTCHKRIEVVTPEEA